jgi:uncharacterized protein
MSPQPEDRPRLDLGKVGRLVEELFPEALGVWVYGSFAENAAREDSDIDIAILSKAPLAFDWHDLGRIGDLDGRLGRRIDLVDLKRVSPLLRFEVFSHGVRVAARDPVACDFFETRSISEFQRLNLERREIFEAIRERGTVY